MAPRIVKQQSQKRRAAYLLWNKSSLMLKGHKTNAAVGLIGRLPRQAALGYIQMIPAFKPKANGYVTTPTLPIPAGHFDSAINQVEV